MLIIHASRKSCFHALWSGAIYFGGFYDTKIANKIQRLSPVGVDVGIFCILPQLMKSIWQQTMSSAATTLGSHRHQELLRALSRGQECSSPGRSHLLLTKHQDELHSEHMGNTVLYSGLFLFKKKTNKQQKASGLSHLLYVVVTDITSLDKLRAFTTSAAQENSETTRISWKKNSFYLEVTASF